MGVQQYNGSGSNLDTYLQWRTRLLVNDTYAFSPTFLGSFTYGFARRSRMTATDPAANGPMDVICEAMRTGISRPSSPAINILAGMPNFNDNANGRSTEGTGEDGVSLGSRATLITNNTYSFFATFSKENGESTPSSSASDFRNIALQLGESGNCGCRTPSLSAACSPQQARRRLHNKTQTTVAAAKRICLLGLPQGGSLAQAAPLYLKDDYLGLYLQDTWKVTRKLTFTVGLRYDLETPYTERNNNVAYGFSNAPLGINTSILNGASTTADQAALLAGANAVVIPGFNPNLSGGLVFTGVNGRPRTEGRLTPTT